MDSVLADIFTSFCPLPLLDQLEVLEAVMHDVKQAAQALAS
jgi:hypothetical protein